MKISDSLINSVAGTGFYMSPEIVNGHGYSYKADVWSAGCVVYEIITLKKAFGSEKSGLYQVLSSIINDPLPEINQSMFLKPLLKMYIFIFFKLMFKLLYIACLTILGCLKRTQVNVQPQKK